MPDQAGRRRGSLRAIAHDAAGRTIPDAEFGWFDDQGRMLRRGSVMPTSRLPDSDAVTVHATGAARRPDQPSYASANARPSGPRRHRRHDRRNDPPHQGDRDASDFRRDPVRDGPQAGQRSGRMPFRARGPPRWSALRRQSSIRSRCSPGSRSSTNRTATRTANRSPRRASASGGRRRRYDRYSHRPRNVRHQGPERRLGRRHSGTVRSSCWPIELRRRYSHCIAGAVIEMIAAIARQEPSTPPWAIDCSQRA